MIDLVLVAIDINVKTIRRNVHDRGPFYIKAVRGHCRVDGFPQPRVQQPQRRVFQAGHGGSWWWWWWWWCVAAHTHGVACQMQLDNTVVVVVVAHCTITAFATAFASVSPQGIQS